MSGKLKVGLYQYQCRDEDAAARLARLDRTLAQVDGTPDLVICPELFLSGYNVGDRIRRFAEPQGGASSQAASALARKRRTALIYGYPEQAGDVLYNSASCIDAHGRTIAHHRKLLLPNEFERTNFLPGNACTLFSLQGWDIALLVCYDVEFPEAVRACAARGAQLIVAPTALKKEWAFVARHMIPTRAFENGVFVAYVNYCGREGSFDYLGESCLAGPGGKITAAAAVETLLILELDLAEIAAARCALPYLEDRAILGRLGP